MVAHLSTKDKLTSVQVANLGKAAKSCIAQIKETIKKEKKKDA